SPLSFGGRGHTLPVRPAAQGRGAGASSGWSPTGRTGPGRPTCVDAVTPISNQRGAKVGAALLVEYYQRMPTRRAKEDAEAWRRRQDEGRQKFLQLAQARYTEGTLLRLLESGDVRARRAALLALGKFGGMDANESVAA